MNSVLRGANVVVTGGAGNLGPYVIAALLRVRANVYVPLRSERAVILVVDMVDAQMNAQECDVACYSQNLHVKGCVDLSKEESVMEYYNELPPLVGSIHLAGCFLQRAFDNINMTDVSREISGNFMTSLLCSRAAAQIIARGGCVINFGARAGTRKLPIVHSASKAAVLDMSRNLAVTWCARGVRVYCILPYIVDTAVSRAALPHDDRSEWSNPIEIAELIVQLCSEDCCYETAIVC